LFDFERLSIVPGHPLVTSPGDNLDGRRLVKRHRSPVFDDLDDLGGRENTWRAGTLPSVRSIDKLTPSCHTAGVLHGEATPVEAEAHMDAFWVDIVAP
jgi:hypothetical protein